MKRLAWQKQSHVEEVRLMEDCVHRVRMEAGRTGHAARKCPPNICFRNNRAPQLLTAARCLQKRAQQMREQKPTDNYTVFRHARSIRLSTKVQS